jgi:hypothetical protein
MADVEIVEIGFSGGQVIVVRLEPAKLKELRKALDKPDGFADIKSVQGTISLDLAQVQFIRTDAPSQSVGFSG